MADDQKNILYALAEARMGVLNHTEAHFGTYLQNQLIINLHIRTRRLKNNSSISYTSELIT